MLGYACLAPYWVEVSVFGTGSVLNALPWLSYFEKSQNVD